MKINGDWMLKLLSVLFFVIGALFFTLHWLAFKGFKWPLPFDGDGVELMMGMIGISLVFLGAAAFRSQLKPYAWVVSCYALPVLYWAALVLTPFPEIDPNNQIKFIAALGGFPVSLVLIAFSLWKKTWFFTLLGFVPAVFSLIMSRLFFGNV